MADTIQELQNLIREFRDERDWMQFHNHKDMATALAIEAAELQELFLWKHGQEIEEIASAKRERLSEELADVAVYLLELADNLGIDLGEAIVAKMAKNAAKYPVHKAKGSSAKYTEL
jgi:NTP pyrophosphatase (non-canonical NTP hydrolase)